MYGNSGVCEIIDIRQERFAGKTPRTYYVLKPVADPNSTIYYPADADGSKMKKLLTKEEIFALIASMPDTEYEWIENDAERKEAFTAILKSGDHAALIGLVKILHFHKQERLQAGKKLHLADERIQKEAESMLFGEFAHVLQLQPNQVVDFITGKLQHLE